VFILEANKILMEFGDRKLFSIKSQKIYSHDKIGIVGENGAGKTTLLEIIAGRQKPTSGSILLNTSFGYIQQLNDSFDDEPYSSNKNAWGVVKSPKSGGEISRAKISKALNGSHGLLLCDEPASNLDERGILQLEKELIKYKGAIMLVSHDRELMDKVCNRIWEIEEGEIRVFSGNYSEYREQKEKKRQNQQKEYDKYIAEKKGLQSAINNRSSRAKNMTRTPSRMGNSEARLHRMDVRQRAGKISGAAKNLKNRLDKLEQKEKPRAETSYKLMDTTDDRKKSKIAIRVDNLSFGYDDSLIIDGISFDVPKGDKLCITGDNGSGKTTLIDCIVNERDGIRIAPNNSIGYFQQNCLDLKEDDTIFESVMRKSRMPEYAARSVLAGLGIKRDDVYKRIFALSGGERCKVSLSSLICRMCTILILDEPTNYLDIYVLEALEKMLMEYSGTLIAVSHDRYFREKITDRELKLDIGKITEKGRNETDKNSNRRTEILLLELKKTKILKKIREESDEGRRNELEKLYEETLKSMDKIKTGCDFSEES